MKQKIEFKPNQNIIFTGDSITDCGRTDPAYAPFGNGYVHFTANYLLARFPNYDLNIINTGISGDTTSNLKNRWQRDCINHQPDILSILIGINDLWRQYGDFDRRPSAVYPEIFESNYRDMLTQVKEQCPCKIILAQPFMFCNDPQNQMFKELITYIDIVQKLAEQFDALLVPLQDHIDSEIINTQPQKWADEMVHPFTWAHAWIPQKWLPAVGL